MISLAEAVDFPLITYNLSMFSEADVLFRIDAVLLSDAVFLLLCLYFERTWLSALAGAK